MTPDIIEECADAAYSASIAYDDFDPPARQPPWAQLVNIETYEPERWREVARKVFSRLQSLGYCVVPRIPTEAMCEAGTEALYDRDRPEPLCAIVYSDMIAMIDASSMKKD